MNEIDYFKVFVFCSGDVAADVDHLHVKRIHLVGFSYIVIEDTVVHMPCNTYVRGRFGQGDRCWRSSGLLCPDSFGASILSYPALA
jgi:hypothetical protein